MLKVSYISDLHLDFHGRYLDEQPFFINTSESDVLIIAGDLAESRNILKGYYDVVLNQISSEYKTVIYVLGNHEFYFSKVYKTNSLLKEKLESEFNNIHLLNPGTIEIDNVVFIGATFWTNFGNLNQLSIQKAKNYMNDYRTITIKDKKGIYRKLHPNDVLDFHFSDKRYIEEKLLEYKDKKVVVVTHHAPSQLSIHPIYSNDIAINDSYYSNQFELIDSSPQIVLWVHGHTHIKCDYTISNTRIVCNPFGYKYDSHPLTGEIIDQVFPDTFCI